MGFEIAGLVEVLGHRGFFFRQGFEIDIARLQREEKLSSSSST